MGTQAKARIVGLALFLPTAAVLGIAAWLEPDPSGVGTHTQLGLSGCAMLTWTGWPCPMCGMTTTFSLLAHLRVVDAVRNQPFGLLLFGATVLTCGVGLLELLAPRRRVEAALDWMAAHEVALAGGTLAGLLAGWVHKIIVLQGPFIGAS
jgi:hypothetical protein